MILSLACRLCMTECQSSSPGKILDAAAWGRPPGGWGGGGCRLSGKKMGILQSGSVIVIVSLADVIVSLADQLCFMQAEACRLCSWAHR